jgi:hypothetical protein
VERIKFPLQGVLRGGSIDIDAHVIICDRRAWRTMPEASSPHWSPAFIGDDVVAIALDFDDRAPSSDRSPAELVSDLVGRFVARN